ncbi:peroxiredoxin, partial [Dehalococcoides mccartyi]
MEEVARAMPRIGDIAPQFEAL